MKQLRLLFILLLVSLLVACGNNGESTAVATEPPPNSEQPTIALVMKTLTNPFFVEMERGARRAEEEFGIELIVKTAAQETSIEQQIAIVDNLIRDQVDGIVIAPGDSLELIPILKEAQDAGIVVINIDNQLNPEYSATLGLSGVPFISVNNEQAAYLSAKTISDMITEPTEVIILEGIRGAQNAEDRKNGALRAFAENPNVTIVAMETANWKIGEAHDVTGQLFAEHPNVKAIFAANDMMALGTVQYLQEAGLTDVQVAAFDALTEAKEAIRNGEMVVTIDQQAAEQGYLGVDYALKALNGETLPPETYIDVKVVTADNLSDE